jgi:hypothetical protein
MTAVDQLGHGPTRPTSPRPTPRPAPSGPRPPTPRPTRADVLGDARRLTWMLIAELDAQRDPAPDVPSGRDRQLGNMVAELRLMMAELQDLSHPAPRSFGAPGRAGDRSNLGLLPGRTEEAAGSAADGGSAERSGEVSGAGSKPPGSYPGMRPSPGLPADAAASVAAGEAPDLAAAGPGAGDLLTGVAPVAAFALPPTLPSWARPVGGYVWPGTRDIARQVADGARRRAG